MPVVLLIVGLVVLAAVVYAAMGRGGELSAERTDHAPLELGPVSATDVALLRPPSAAWGYDMQTTDEALERIADAMRQRDVRIVALEQLVTDLSRNPAPAVPLGRAFPGARRAVEAPEPPEPAQDTLAAAPVREPAPPEPASAAERQPQQHQPPQQQQSQQRQQLRQPPPERSHG